MAKAYQQLRKRTESRKRRTLTARTNFVARIAALEVMLFENNSRQVRLVHERLKTPEGTISPSEAEADFLQAAEEFRQHLTGVINGS